MKATIYKFPGLPGGDFPKLAAALAARRNIPVNDMLATMQAESGFNPAQPNIACKNAGRAECPTGLLQFTPSTAQSMGTTVAQLADMSASQQLRYVETHFARTLPKGTTIPGDVYVATFMPAFVGKPHDAVIARKTAECTPKSRDIYCLNKVFDFADKGFIDVDDVRTLNQGMVANAKARGAFEVEFDPATDKPPPYEAPYFPVSQTNATGFLIVAAALGVGIWALSSRRFGHV